MAVYDVSLGRSSHATSDGINVEERHRNTTQQRERIALLQGTTRETPVLRAQKEEILEESCRPEAEDIKACSRWPHDSQDQRPLNASRLLGISSVTKKPKS